VTSWRFWKGRPWARLGWLQGALFLITVIVGLGWYSRARLPYNSEGRWYDEEQMVVYDKASEEVLRLAFMICFTAWVISIVGAAWHSRSRVP
jgi:hypothetical protein